MEDRIKLEDLINILEELKLEYDKLYNREIKISSTRLRKKLQELIRLSKKMRKQIIEFKKNL